MLKTISKSEAKERFEDILMQLQRDRTPLGIAENSRLTAVLLSIDQYQTLLNRIGDFEDYFDVLTTQQENDGDLQSVLAELRREQVGQLFEAIERIHALNLPPLTQEEIEAEIQAARAERRLRHARHS